MAKRKYNLYDEDYFDKINKISWSEILLKLGLTPPSKIYKIVGQAYRMRCIFHHGEKTPSLILHITDGYFHCLGCNTKGTKFIFVERKLRGKNKAIHFFRRHFHITPPKIGVTKKSNTAKEPPKFRDDNIKF